MARPRSEVARAKMLDAAVDLLKERGVPGFTIDEVARRSGVAKTTIYRHFPTKNELLVAGLDQLTPVPVTPDSGSLRDDLLIFLESVLPIFADRAIRAVFFDVWSAATRDPELDHLQRMMMAGRAAPTAAIINRAKERGEIADDLDYLAVVEIIEGPFIVRSLTRPHTLTDIDLEPLVDRMLLQLKP